MRKDCPNSYAKNGGAVFALQRKTQWGVQTPPVGRELIRHHFKSSERTAYLIRASLNPVLTSAKIAISEAAAPLSRAVCRPPGADASDCTGSRASLSPLSLSPSPSLPLHRGMARVARYKIGRWSLEGISSVIIGYPPAHTHTRIQYEIREYYCRVCRSAGCSDGLCHSPGRWWFYFCRHCCSSL